MQATIEERQTIFRAEAINELMHEHELSMTAFAKRIGITRQAVAAYTVRVMTPQLSTVLRMADAFDKPLTFFVERKTER